MPITLSPELREAADLLRLGWLDMMRFGDDLYCVRRDCRAQILVPFYGDNFQPLGRIALVINGAVEIWWVTVDGQGLDNDWILLPYPEDISRRYLQSPTLRRRSNLLTQAELSPIPAMTQEDLFSAWQQSSQTRSTVSPAVSVAPMTPSELSELPPTRPEDLDLTALQATMQRIWEIGMSPQPPLPTASRALEPRE